MLEARKPPHRHSADSRVPPGQRSEHPVDLHRGGDGTAGGDGADDDPGRWGLQAVLSRASSARRARTRSQCSRRPENRRPSPPKCTGSRIRRTSASGLTVRQRCGRTVDRRRRRQRTVRASSAPSVSRP